MNTYEIAIGFILGYVLSSAIDWILIQKGIITRIKPEMIKDEDLYENSY